jgi:hypothetical protein
MLLVGESINGTRKQVGEAITARDAEFIKGLAIDQDKAGAEVLDVNAGVAGGDEVADMLWLIETVRSVPCASWSIGQPGRLEGRRRSPFRRWPVLFITPSPASRSARCRPAHYAPTAPWWASA